jgi:hypothetical protein
VAESAENAEEEGKDKKLTAETAFATALRASREA